MSTPEDDADDAWTEYGADGPPPDDCGTARSNLDEAVERLETVTTEGGCFVSTATRQHVPAHDVLRAARTVLSALAASNARAEAAEEAETGWLIESDVNGPVYHRAGGAVTRNAAEALRFARQQDAEAFIRAYGPNQYDSVLTPPWRAVEHRWG